MTSLSVSSCVQTRNRTIIYLLGTSAESGIKGSKLPSNRQVLSTFFYHHKTLKKTIRESSRAVIREVLLFWSKARIPTRDEQHSIAKMEKLFDRWSGLKKSSKRKTETQRSNETAFVDKLDDLFDIAHADAMSMITVTEDREFLLRQREKGRQGCMMELDTTLAKKELRAENRKKVEMFRIEREKHRVHTSANTSQSTCIMKETNFADNVTKSSDRSDKESDDSEDYAHYQGFSQVHRPQKRAKRNTNTTMPVVITPKLASTLDRANISDRKATLIVAATVESMGQNVEDFTLSHSSIRRQRQTIRSELAINAQKSFQSKAVAPLIVHWDGKLMQHISGNAKEDRLPVIVSGPKIDDQLLGVPKLQSGTGIAMANAVAELLDKWALTELVRGMCFDTTSSNTGINIGACVTLEQKLGKQLLHFACRHHILEIVLSAVFTQCMGPSTSSGPTVLLFKRFQQSWSTIDYSNFEPGVRNAEVLAAIQSDVQSVMEFAQSQLMMPHAREDNREMLELVIIFLGGTPSRGVRFRAPGAIHHARWMSKILYSFKLWMFRNQFKLAARESKGIRDICIFVVKEYLRAWFTAPLPVQAPKNDLNLLQRLVAYKEENPDVSAVAANKLSRHLWYLSEHLVGLAFFDSDVSVDEKRKMVKSLLERDGEEDPVKRARLQTQEIDELMTSTLSSFVTKNTDMFFSLLCIDKEFLQIDPEHWELQDSYQRGIEVTKKLRVVNDNAERGVALIEAFDKTITKNEEQKQCLLQVVQEHRKKYQGCKKSTFKN